jgi:spore coat protein U-like protein
MFPRIKSWNKSIYIATFVFVALALTSQNAIATDEGKTATASAIATATVLTSIQLQKLTDLAFGQTWRGAAGKTVLPADSSAASFTVTADGGHAYTIILPADNTVKMVTSAAGNNTINVNTFTSTPSVSGTVSGTHAADGTGTGTQTLYVGATRDPIATDQAFGDYAGTFTVTVSY